MLRGKAPPCAQCTLGEAPLQPLGGHWANADYVLALAGNPNTGKSTVFNALTGLRQHTGNWPGKTVVRAEGGFDSGGQRYKLIDLPGTYSLLSTSADEEVARDFILFGNPDVVVVVADATRLERNLNLVLQVLQITQRVVVCLNLMDEAKRNGLTVDADCVAEDLGVPVVPLVARTGEGLPQLLQAIAEVAAGRALGSPYRPHSATEVLERAVAELVPLVAVRFPGLANAHWVALRLLDGDARIVEAVERGELDALVVARVAGDEQRSMQAAQAILQKAEVLRWEVGSSFHEELMEAIYADAARIADRAVRAVRPEHARGGDLDRQLDRLLTSRRWGFPVMLALLALVFWLTLSGANYPSQLLYAVLIDWLHPLLQSGAASVGLPWWLRGVLIDGMYLATAWVVSVMLPPMAIFFPLFTLLEDFGYLPRLAFNMDDMYRRVGAHGKQALTSAMGFGCNAAGVVAARIIDSPRERLIAILTNNFSLCNGRWPTQILIASIFIGALAPGRFANSVAALAVVAVALFGMGLSLGVSWLLSRTLLKGEASSFYLELPPYRRPRFWQTIYTSLIDRTLIVLWRAVVFAAPAGLVIWSLANIQLQGISIAEHLVHIFDPFAVLLGLNGVVLLAYIVAIPANEIVIPTVLMLTVLMGRATGVGAGACVMFEGDAASVEMVLRAGGWTLLTAVNLMLFSLLHNPCSTTLYTIYKETGSGKWTLLAALLPLCMGLLTVFAVAQVWFFLAGGG